LRLYGEPARIYPNLGRLAPEKFVLFLTAAIGAAEAAENQYPYARGDEHGEEGAKRE
jgi:hypothetical protein